MEHTNHIAEIHACDILNPRDDKDDKVERLWYCEKTEQSIVIKKILYHILIKFRTLLDLINKFKEFVNKEIKLTIYKTKHVYIFRYVSYVVT